MTAAAPPLGMMGHHAAAAGAGMTEQATTVGKATVVTWGGEPRGGR